MSKAFVDPVELRRFAQELGRFNHEMHQLTSGLHAKMRQLEQTWRDQEQRKFAESFEQTMRGVQQFLGHSQEHVSALTKKATLIEEYLKQR